MKNLLWALLFVSAFAMADTLVSYTIPTTRTDGTPLAVSEIDHYTLYINDVIAQDNIPATATSVQLTLSPGTYSFKMNTTDTEGRIGPFSPAVQSSVRGTPGAPTIVTIEFKK